MLDLTSAVFRDKVYGCWMGKHCGGTLGAPLEEAWGRPEPFDVWWYPELREGGIPNDDLEMQLLWLKALEEVGPALRAADLAQYWLNHIGYNFDEYGLSKMNLRLGLAPPVSGAFNNWFKDCMGSPIRSEIWACVAPGVPTLAARYAYEDAICDHAGGEGVFGELFNAAVESAAFVVPERELLLDIGLSYLPPWSMTYKAVVVARAAHAAGDTWQGARARVLATTPHHVAQYAPINLAFQVIGWLYGDNFGDALCKAVNCGYDTDCTGATLGSVLGILAGRSGLPVAWTAPLSEAIATNESWGGIRHASTAPNPIPATMSELTERVCAVTKRVLTAHGRLQGTLVDLGGPDALFADAATRALWDASPMRVEYRTPTLHMGVDYGATPAVRPGETKRITTLLTNPHPEPLRARCALIPPEGWAPPPAQHVALKPFEQLPLSWTISAPAAAQMQNSNRFQLLADVEARPAQPSAPITLIGAHNYRYAGPYPAAEHTDRELFDYPLAPEAAGSGAALTPDGRPGAWAELFALDNGIPLEALFEAGGVLYVQTFLWSPEARDVWIAPAATCPLKVWLNNSLIVQRFRYQPLRPDYRGDEDARATVALDAGWNELLLKFVRNAAALPFACHLMISAAGPFFDGLPSIGRTRLPWDKE